MEYCINLKNWGRMFTVPCSVVDEHIKLASGNCIKVLLCIFCSSTNKIQSEAIAQQLGISVDEVDDAIAFWQQYEVISSTGSSVNLHLAPPSSEKSAVETFTPSTVEAIVPSSETNLKKTTVRYSPKDIEKLVENSSDMRFLFDNIQTILKRPITYTEQCFLIKLREYYGFSAEVILMLFDYCDSIGKTSSAYVEAIASSWFEKDITSHEAVEKEIIRLIDKNSYEYKISSAFGLTTRLTPKQKEYIENWSTLGLSLDLITFAYEKCVDSLNKLSMPYINKILTSWAEKGFKSRNDVNADDIKVKKDTPKEKEHSYDLDEFYKLALNKYKK